MKRECVSHWTFSQQQPPTEWCSERLVWVSLVLTLRVIRIELLYWIIPFQSNNSTWPAKTCVNYCKSPQYFETWKFAVKRSLWHVFHPCHFGKNGAHQLGLCCLFTASLGYEVIFLPTTLCHAFHEVHLQAGSSLLVPDVLPFLGGSIASSGCFQDWCCRCCHGKTREPITAGMELLSVNMPCDPIPFPKRQTTSGSCVIQEIYDPQVKFALLRVQGRLQTRMWPLPSWQLHTNYVTFPPRQYELGWMISNILSIIHVCDQANSPNPNLYNFGTMKVRSDFTTMTHISDTKSYILSKYMFHHILVTHGYETHIHIPDSTQFKFAFNHFAVCSKCSLPMSMNQFTSGELSWLQPISRKSANVFSTRPSTSFKPIALYQSIPLLCLSNGSMVLSIAILFLSKKHLLNRHSWTQTTTHGPIKQSQVVGALKKYCDKLPQFNSKGIPPEPASMHSLPPLHGISMPRFPHRKPTCLSLN